jgi:putative PEP-CTERM system TPR-repeat lipoprotein
VPLAQAYMLQKMYLSVTNMALTQLNVINKIDLIVHQGRAFQYLGDNNNAFSKYQLALSMQPDNVKVLMALTAIYIKNKDLNSAQKLLTQLNGLSADIANISHFQGEILKQQNAKVAAQGYYKKAHELKPNDVMFARVLAHSYIESQQYIEARIVIGDILKVAPDEPSLLLLNAHLFTINSKNKLAKKAYGVLVEKFSGVPIEVIADIPELQYMSGLADYMLGHYEKAAIQIKQSLVNKEDNLTAIIILADIYMKQEATNSAIKLMEKHSTLIKKDLIVSMRWCNQYLKNDKKFKCDSLISELEKLHGEQTVLHLMRVKVLQAYGDFSKALAYFEETFSEVNTEQLQRTAAVLYFQNKKANKAFELVETLLKQQPNDVGYLLLKSDLLIHLNKYEAASKVTELILNRVPKNFQAQYNQAQLLYLNRYYAQAQKATEKLSIIEPNSYLVNLLLANTLYAQKKFDQALEIYYKIKKSTNLKPSEQIVSIYRQQGKLALALEELNNLTRQKILVPKYIQAKAEIHIQQNKPDSAQKEYKKLYGLWQDDHEKLLILGRMLRENELFEDAEIFLLRGLYLAPNFVYTKIELLRLYLTMDEIEKAELLLKPLMISHHENANVQLTAGDIARHKEQLHAAQKHYYQALTLNNNYKQAITRLYNLTVQHNVGVDAFEQLLTRIVQQFPEASFQRYILADYWLTKGNEDKAKEHYLFLANSTGFPNKKYIFNNLANIMMHSDSKEALAFIDKAINLDQSIADFYDTKGWILVLNGQVNKGLSFLRQAYTLDASHPSNLYHLGYTLTELNRINEALIVLNKALALQKDFPEIKQTRQLIKKIST